MFPFDDGPVVNYRESEAGLVSIGRTYTARVARKAIDAIQ